MRLRDLAGQDQAKALLLRAVEAGRLAHAYLFDGPPGVGKRSAAVGLGLALACPEEPGAGCGACAVCRRVLAGHHPDVRTIAPAGPQIVIDQVQEVVLMAASRPHEAPARVIVVDEADRMNPSAANCLLKTLEEPFPGTHLVLVTTAPERLLATLRSRTQRVRFGPVRAATLVEIALSRGVGAQGAETAAALAGGSVARLIELAEGDGGLWESVMELRRAAARAEMAPLFDAAAGDKEERESLPEVLALLGRFYRDALAAAAGAPELVLLRERSAELEAVAEAARRAPKLLPLRRAVEAVVEAQGALAANVNPVIAIERMLMIMRPCERSAAA